VIILIWSGAYGVQSGAPPEGSSAALSESLLGNGFEPGSRRLPRCEMKALGPVQVSPAAEATKEGATEGSQDERANDGIHDEGDE
jgi:hypothetical protein